MTLKENKEQLVTMLCSKDAEIRRIALNIINNNYITDFEYALPYSENNIKFNVNDFLKEFISNQAIKEWAEILLNLIIEYNEFKGRQRAIN